MHSSSYTHHAAAAAQAAPAIVASAPLRVSFSGGGTDVEPYSRDFGGCALSSTIDMSVCVNLVPTAGTDVRVAWRAGTATPAALGGDGPLLLARQVLDVIGHRDGVRCEIHCRAAFGSGLGSSSALVTALLAAVDEHRGTGLDRHALARQAFHVERELLGHAGGAHDQFASAYGGTNFFEFHGGTDVRVTPVPGDTARLTGHLLLYDTGLRRKSDRIVRRQMAQVDAGDPACLDAMGEMKRLTVRMWHALRRGDLVEFGELMHRGWQHKRSLAPGISNPVLDELYERGRAAGALGGRVVGAGGGGYLLFVADPARRAAVDAALAGGGGRRLPFSVRRRGVRVLRASPTVD